IKSSSSRPTGSSTNAVTTAVSSPKQRFSPRATLYSPPPSHTSNDRAVAIRRSPGSNRTITSPRLSRSHRHSFFGLIVSAFAFLNSNHLLSSERQRPLRQGAPFCFLLFTRFLPAPTLAQASESPPAPPSTPAPPSRTESCSFP